MFPLCSNESTAAVKRFIDVPVHGSTRAASKTLSLEGRSARAARQLRQCFIDLCSAQVSKPRHRRSLAVRSC